MKKVELILAELIENPFRSVLVVAYYQRYQIILIDKQDVYEKIKEALLNEGYVIKRDVYKEEHYCLYL